MFILKTHFPEFGTGIYSIFDPAAKKKAFRFSPPFFSPSDQLAKGAVLETLVSRFSSLDELKASLFLNYELWYIGAFEFTSGKLLSRSQFKRRRVCLLRDYVFDPDTLLYLSSLTFDKCHEKE